MSGTTSMNHERAIEIEATERYLLDELTPEEREEFEAHYFSCPECADAVKTSMSFAVNARAVAKAEREQAEKLRRNPTLGRLRMPRWMTQYVPAAAAAMLAIVVSYQSLVTIPGLEARSARPEVLTAEVLRPQARGDSGIAQVPAGRAALLPLEVNADHPQPAYQVTILANGSKVWETLQAPAKDGVIEIALPAGFPVGRYEILVRGQDGTDAGRYLFQKQ